MVYLVWREKEEKSSFNELSKGFLLHNLRPYCQHLVLTQWWIHCCSNPAKWYIVWTPTSVHLNCYLKYVSHIYNLWYRRYKVVVKFPFIKPTGSFHWDCHFFSMNQLEKKRMPQACKSNWKNLKSKEKLILNFLAFINQQLFKITREILNGLFVSHENGNEKGGINLWHTIMCLPCWVSCLV